MNNLLARVGSIAFVALLVGCEGVEPDVDDTEPVQSEEIGDAEQNICFYPVAGPPTGIDDAENLGGAPTSVFMNGQEDADECDYYTAIAVTPSGNRARKIRMETNIPAPCSAAGGVSMLIHTNSGSGWSNVTGVSETYTPVAHILGGVVYFTCKIQKAYTFPVNTFSYVGGSVKLTDWDPQEVYVEISEN